ncbi:hypothetical protein VOI32_38170 [Paraburkholderia caribensis]|uniref:Uncharacterized protein n=1 Tax=Paraburkholderia caribensis TaxID=75105 RepID=A0ABV0E8D3_9BURK|nr:MULTISPECIES: hypothetical protein [Paraburkholderia]MCO4882455.1 hypothetical protein [Paraburkholderia caribensis]
MTHSTFGGGGGNAPEVSDVYVVAIYDPKTGKILHTHNVTVFKGGRSVTEKEALDTAFARASDAGHQTDNLKSTVSKNPQHGRSPHKIDLATGQFIPVPAKRPLPRQLSERKDS